MRPDGAGVTLTIDASVPVLREHGLAITQTFYRNMFAAHPELTNLFNMGNQASGVQQQSLATAVFAYAANIDNAAALAPVVSRIVHKHASVGITAEHYPIVGRYLLGAIQEVLGEAATPALIAAWDEAYNELATALINAESALYAKAGTTPGQLSDMRVLHARHESEDVKSFVLAMADGSAVHTFTPGQYVSVSVTFDNGATQLRQYSLSDAPNGKTLRISVKRESDSGAQPAGQVSNWLHNNVSEGSVLKVTHPFGDFTCDTASDAPIVLLSAGVGITPMIAALNHIARINPQRHVVFAHAARAAVYHPHRADVAAAKAVMPHLVIASFHENLSADNARDGALFQGRMEISKIPAWPYDQANVYMCGPVPFMQDQWRALIDAGVPAHRLHREVFGPELLNYVQ
ncbi:NO-inducible flavohemoprotein [Massilia sp. PAMC28688]|uniref:NO-inducible flavohemoprotein n=1 Tax=Massilia sp. PAMC28688 TaxID=2861283 RepID=UPI001C628102|nr:NO-inducible flavohemoprotein [Massilia sp. PAMC28688]QYF91717.1 NO-inducible flavohemoprotein [Massilia sp. PAMC28688]